MYEYKGSGMGSGNEAENLYNNSVIVDLTALLIATWLGWPDTPPSSKVTICRKESATSNSNPSLWLVASTSLHCQASTKTAYTARLAPKQLVITIRHQTATHVCLALWYRPAVVALWHCPAVVALWYCPCCHGNL